MDVFSHDGTCVFTGKWSAITASKGFDANYLTIPPAATHFVRYSVGTDFALTVGETVTGAAASAVVVAQVIDSGTIAADTAAGTLFLKAVSGTFTAETITGATSGGTAAILQAPIVLSPHASNPRPKALLVVVETASILCTIGGSLATTTATQDDGVIMSAGQSRVIRGVQNIKTFQAINAVNANGGVMKWELYY